MRVFSKPSFQVWNRQDILSDLIHFSTIPQGLMLAVWVALEDIHEDSGPLLAYAGSHKLNMRYYGDLGITDQCGECNPRKKSYDSNDCLQACYGRELRRQVLSNLPPPKKVLIKKGDAFVWAANLLHGGSAILNPNLTRMSQVTHYFLEGAHEYWVPRQSNISLGQLKEVGEPFGNLQDCNFACYLQNYFEEFQRTGITTVAQAKQHYQHQGWTEARSCTCRCLDENDDVAEKPIQP